MNFKFTLWKTIFSIVIGYAISYMITSGVIVSLGFIHDLVYNIGLYGLWVVFAVATYCIWSIIQKRR